MGNQKASRKDKNSLLKYKVEWECKYVSYRETGGKTKSEAQKRKSYASSIS